MCDILEYSNVKKALQEHVKSKHKKDLKTIIDELGPVLGPNYIQFLTVKPTYHDGKTVYINEPGLYALIMKSRTSFVETFQNLKILKT